MAFTREQIEDFIAALHSDAELRERVRGAILADDFQALPGLVRANTEAIAALTERMDALTERMDAFIEATSLRFLDIDRTLREVSGRVGNLEGGAYESKYLWQAPGRWGRAYSGIRVVRLGEEPELYKAFESGRLSAAEWDDVILTDCVLRGISRQGQQETIVAIELSLAVDTNDVERANRRAGILRRVWPHVVAAVDGERILGPARERAAELGVQAVVQREASEPPAA